MDAAGGSAGSDADTSGNDLDRPPSGVPPKWVTFALISVGIAIVLLIGALAGSDEGEQPREQGRQERELDTAMRVAQQARLDQRAYDQAVAALDAKRYLEAIGGFESIRGYRDASTLLREARSGLAARKRAERRRRIAAERRRRAREERRRLVAEQRRLERIEREQAEAAPPPVDSGGACDPNYGGCVPQASDVDCAGGSGDGPEYVSGPIPITGSDVYGLDSDGDGVACE
jgi:hypothetical protein